MDYSLPGSSLHRFPRQEYQSGLSFSSPGDLPNPGINTVVDTAEPPGKPIYMCIYLVLCYAKMLQSCLTLYDPMDCGPPCPSIHGILQERTVEWLAITSSRGSSRPRDQTWVSWIAGRFFTIWATREAPLNVQMQTWCLQKHFDNLNLQ